MSMIPYKRNDPTALGQGGLYPLTVPEPSLGEVIDASVQEAWFGVGTGYADNVDYSVNEKMISGTPIDEQTFNRDFSRYGISYIDGMTAEAAQELANYHIDRGQTSQTLSAATSGDYFAGMAAGFAVGIVEPKNLAYGVGTSLALSPLGGGTAAFARSYRRIQQLRRAGQYTALRAGDYAALARGGAVESMVSAAIMEPSNRDTAQTLQMDYTMADSLWNIGLSTVLGAGLTSLPPLARAKYDKWKGRTHEIVAHEIDLATEQLVTGQKVDVTPIEKLAVGEVEKLPVAEKAAAVEQYVKYTETPEFKARFEGSKVVDADGKPLLMFRGSPNKAGRAYKDGEFVFLTGDKNFADLYAKNGGQTYSFYAVSKNPFDASQGDGYKIFQKFLKETNQPHYASSGTEKGVLPYWTIKDDLVKWLDKNNVEYDAIYFAESNRKSSLAIKGFDNLIPALGADDADAIARRIDAENQAALSKATTESLSPYSSTAIDKAAVDTLDAMPLADKPDYAKQYDSSVEKMRAMVDEGALSKEEFDAFMDAADNNNESDTLEALKDLETCLAGLV